MAADGGELLSTYLDDIAQYPFLSPGEEIVLMRALGTEARDEAVRSLVQTHLRLVVSIAETFEGASLDMLGRIQIGNQELMNVALELEPRQAAATFAELAGPRVAMAIARAVGDADG